MLPTLDEIYSDFKDWVKWLSKSSRESKNNMEEDLVWLKSKFFDLGEEDQKGLIDIIDFILNDGSLIEIKMDDKDKNFDLNKCANILRVLPREKLNTLYNMFTHKIQHKKSLRDVLSLNKN